MQTPSLSATMRMGGSVEHGARKRSRTHACQGWIGCADIGGANSHFGGKNNGSVGPSNGTVASRNSAGVLSIRLVKSSNDTVGFSNRPVASSNGCHKSTPVSFLQGLKAGGMKTEGLAKVKESDARKVLL
jgi:hypothetical protein